MGWVHSLLAVLRLIVDLYREWRRKRVAERTQAEFDAIERDPVPEFRRMFDRDKRNGR
jgi:hypothetical protein